MHQQHYSKGQYLVRHDLAYAAQVEEFITSLAFKRHQDVQLVHPSEGRKRNTLYTFYFAPAQKHMVMKAARIDPAYSTWRRMELFLTSVFRDYNKRAYLGSIAMENAGVNTAKPVAFWTYNQTYFQRESYYMYERVNADFKMFEYQQRIGSNPTPDQRILLQHMIDKAIDMLKDLSHNGIRHGDPHVGNFLVVMLLKEGEAGIETVAQQMQLYLIDNDHVSIARVRIPWIKRVFDLKSLRRIRLDDKGRKEFLKRFLEDEYQEFWWWVIEFWAGGGFKLHRWFRRNKKIA